VLCFGDNSKGQLGVQNGYRASATPVYIPIHVESNAFSAGGDHVCAIGGDAQLVCWGSNGSGQLGLPSGTLPKSDQPVWSTL
jgi:alpha-tubulin suppressor-like RCC1 family protein